MRQLLFVIALLLPRAVLAQNPYAGDDSYDYNYDDSDYRDDDTISIDKHFLTPQERAQAALLQSRKNYHHQESERCRPGSRLMQPSNCYARGFPPVS